MVVCVQSVTWFALSLKLAGANEGACFYVREDRAERLTADSLDIVTRAWCPWVDDGERNDVKLYVRRTRLFACRLLSAIRPMQRVLARRLILAKSARSSAVRVADAMGIYPSHTQEILLSRC